MTSKTQNAENRHLDDHELDLDRYGGRNENFVRVWRRPGHPAGSGGGISRAKPLASWRPLFLPLAGTH